MADTGNAAASEMHVILRYGLALLTVADGRTAVAHLTPSPDEFCFSIVTWCDTYEEALTIAQLNAEGDENDTILGALTS